MAKITSPLLEISPDSIKQNPDNPCLIFREEDMNELLQSIKEVGVRVPISVYPDGNKYVLLDGERRWRCSKKLNLPSIPAHIQPKPSRLENLLMMFNIHNVRVDWDIMPMALKLAQVGDMLAAERKPDSPKDLAAITGVRPATVKRALELLELPKRYQTMLLNEAQKPREQQRIKADLFIEIYKSMHAVERYTPVVFEQVTRPQYIDALVNKYITGVIDNVVGYREISKIARAELAGVSSQQAVPAIVNLVKKESYSIKQAYNDTVEAAYAQRDIASKIRGITERLVEYKSGNKITADVRDALIDLRAEIDRLLGD